MGDASIVLDVDKRKIRAAVRELECAYRRVRAPRFERLAEAMGYDLHVTVNITRRPSVWKMSAVRRMKRAAAFWKVRR